jgi:hypothetical protein
MIDTLSIVIVTIINLLITAHYCWQIIKQKIKPSLAMWVFFTIAVLGSLGTYLSEGNYRLIDNILNSTDILLVVSVTIAISVWGDKSTKFNAFDKGCLAAVLAIMGFWLITKSHIVSHLLIQAILVIAYFPVVRRLWTAQENTESFLAWVGMMVAPMFSLLSSKGLLATIYSVRAIACTGLLLLLMLRVELQHRRQST